MNDDDQSIREQAYRIWEEEGRLEGHTERHWATAERMVRNVAAAVEVTPPATRETTTGGVGQAGLPGPQTGRSPGPKAEPPPKPSK